MVQYVNIHAVKSPNPGAIKFSLDGTLLTEGAYDFGNRDEARALSPLADKLFGFDYVHRVFISQDFVTTQIDTEMVEYEKAIIDLRIVIKKHVEFGETVIDLDGSAQENEIFKDDISLQISSLIDAQIRPATRHDGGDITFESFEAGVVKVKLAGACVGCPFAPRTVKHGVEVLLKREFPGSVHVVTSEDVDWSEEEGL